MLDDHNIHRGDGLGNFWVAEGKSQREKPAVILNFWHEKRSDIV
jgi:hypothetical protein